MDNENNFNQFMGQEIDPNAINELVSKNFKLFEKQQKDNIKKLEKEIELQKKTYQKEDELRKLKEKREKDLEKLEEKAHKDKTEKIKNSEKDQEVEKTKSIGLLNFLPDYIKNFKPANNNSEQKDIGETSNRVSFNPEGIKILKTLLEPIYEALKANTDTLNKKLKELIEKMESFGGSTGGLLGTIVSAFLLIMGFGSDIIKIAGRIKDSFVWLWELPGKIITSTATFFEELKIGEKFAKYIKVPTLQLIEELKLEIQGISKALKVDGAFTSFITNLNKFKTTVFETLKLNELGVWISSIWTESVVNPIMNGLKRLNTIKTAATEWVNGVIRPVMNGFNESKIAIGGWLDDIVNLFKAEGKLSGITKMFNSIVATFEGFLGYVKSFEGPLTKILGIFKPFTAVLGFLGRILSIEFLAILDGAISAVKTLFQVWNDIDLDPFQKFTAVFISFIGGLLDIIPNLTSMLSKGLTGVFSWLSGNGWQSDNAVSEFLDKNINDKGGVGQIISKDYIKLAKSANEGTLIDDTVDGLLYRTGLKEPSYKDSQIYKDLSPEQQAEMDQTYEQQLKPQPQPQPQILNEQSQQSLPIQPITPPPNTTNNNDLKEEFKKQTETNKDIAKMLEKLANTLDKNQNNTTVINNNTQTPQQDTNKKYLFKPIFDSNMDKRSEWWKQSRDYASAL